MRVKKITAFVVLASALFNSAITEKGLSQGQAGNNKAEAQQANFDNPAAYYGFDEIEIIKLDWGVQNLRIADFNGDGRKDMAIVNNQKSQIELLIQKEAVGPGETPVAVDPNDIDINAIVSVSRFDRQSVAVSQRIFSFVCGDLNSDGINDLAFYGEPKGLYVILQRAADTTEKKTDALSWQTRKKIKIEDGLLTPNMLVCADLNNDGAGDLAMAGRDAIYIVRQKEDGTLSEPVKYPTAARTLGVEVCDLNGDGINDLVLITDDYEKPIHVRFGLETGQLGPERLFFIERPAALVTANIDGANGDEILTVDATSKRLVCTKLACEQKSEGDWPILFYPLTRGEGTTKRDLVVGDFNGDGLGDVAISDPAAAEIVLYKQTAGLGLAEPLRFPAFAEIENLSAADIDGDGKAEIAVLSIKEKVIGLSRVEDERLLFPKPINLTDEPLAMELADIDGDKNIDCVYISKDANDIRSLKVIYNLAAAEKPKGRSKKGWITRFFKKSGETGSALVLEKLADNPEGIKVLDADQDGLQDVLIFVGYELATVVRQIQKRRFEVIDSADARASLIKEATLSSIAVADVDGKAGKELLVAQKNFARSLVFAEGKNWSVVDQYNARDKENNISAVNVFAIKGTGSMGGAVILLLDGQKGELQILKVGDDQTCRFEKELDVGSWNRAVHLKMLYEPLTGNGVKSVLLFDGEKFALVTPPEGKISERLQEKFSYGTKIRDGLYGNLTAGDINSDGRPDIIMVEYNNNHIEILALDSQARPIPAMRFKVFEQKSYRDSKTHRKGGVEPRELQTADVTGDGKEDLVTVIHDRIIIYPQD